MSIDCLARVWLAIVWSQQLRVLSRYSSAGILAAYKHHLKQKRAPNMHERVEKMKQAFVELKAAGMRDQAIAQMIIEQTTTCLDKDQRTKFKKSGISHVSTAAWGRAVAVYFL